MSTPSPDKILEDIRSWTTAKTKFIIKPFDNPRTYFSIYLTEPEPRKIIPVTVAYPKAVDNKIIMGWNWGPGEMNIKAYAAIKDRARKERILRGIKAQCIARNLILGVEPTNIDNLEQMAITDTIPINEFTERRYLSTLLNLKIMWGFLMYQFEQHNMSRAGFNPSAHI